jgi:hypothetical protein
MGRSCLLLLRLPAGFVLAADNPADKLLDASPFPPEWTG